MSSSPSLWRRWWAEEAQAHDEWPVVPVYLAKRHQQAVSRDETNSESCPSTGSFLSRREGSLSMVNHLGSLRGSRASSIAAEREDFHIDLSPFRLGSAYLSASFSYNSHLSFDSPEEHWAVLAIERPLAEPPILDFRKFEEGGRMYNSVNRHPSTNPEDWHEYTDAEIEVELLGDYHSWIADAALQAKESEYGKSRAVFYERLSRELDIDRQGPEIHLLDIKEKMYTSRHNKNAPHIASGKRCQMQFDEVRKVWRNFDSSDSDWDEQEWNIFGDRSQKTERRENEADTTHGGPSTKRRPSNQSQWSPLLRSMAASNSSSPRADTIYGANSISVSSQRANTVSKASISGPSGSQVIQPKPQQARATGSSDEIKPSLLISCFQICFGCRGRGKRIEERIVITNEK